MVNAFIYLIIFWLTRSKYYSRLTFLASMKFTFTRLNSIITHTNVSSTYLEKIRAKPYDSLKTMLYLFFVDSNDIRIPYVQYLGWQLGAQIAYRQIQGLIFGLELCHTYLPSSFISINCRGQKSKYTFRQKAKPSIFLSAISGQIIFVRNKIILSNAISSLFFWVDCSRVGNIIRL